MTTAVLQSPNTSIPDVVREFAYREAAGEPLDVRERSLALLDAGITQAAYQRFVDSLSSRRRLAEQIAAADDSRDRLAALLAECERISTECHERRVQLQRELDGVFGPIGKFQQEHGQQISAHRDALQRVGRARMEMEQTADPSILRAIETVTRQQEELFAELDSLRSVMRPGRGAGIDPATGKESVNVLRDEAFWERRGGAEAAVRLAGLREARTRMSQIDRAVALCNQRIEQLQEQLLDWRRAAT